MKKIIPTETIMCDICGENESYDKCLKCGKDICYTCIENGKAIKYQHSVHCGGSMDGVYCKQCDERLKSGGDLLYDAYLTIKTLRSEHQTLYESLIQRSDAAEEFIQQLRKNMD